MPEFEYDPKKSKINKEKHGIDFEEAKEVWEGEYAELKTNYVDEPRYMVIGKILEKFWSVIITYREAIIRIISARRSRKNEEEIYRETKAKKNQRS